MVFNRRLLAWLTLPLALAQLSGCGALEQSEGAARLNIVSIKAVDYETTALTTNLQFFGNQVWFDSGDDLDLTTSGGGNMDGLPQPWERVTVPAANDKLTFELMNEPRPGVKDPISLLVYKVVYTYFDANLSPRIFAPQFIQDVSFTLAPKQTAALEVIGVPATMKTTEGGLADILIYGRSADGLYGNNPDLEQLMARTWTVYIDIYALDVKNRDTIHTQSVSTFTFINPEVETNLGQKPPSI